LINPSWNETENLFPVMEALRYHSNHEAIPELVNLRLKEIIDNYLLDRSLKINNDFYFGLMSIPFHQNSLWKRKSMYIIHYWGQIERRGISNVLYSYREYSEEIKNVCKAILINWKIEITKPIKQFYGKPHIGDHIKIAMGHPVLKEKAKQIAIDMKKTMLINPEIIPKHLNSYNQTNY
jgi:phosphoribosylformylglycinamidine (FGAM) synthase PurS component